MSTAAGSIEDGSRGRNRSSRGPVGMDQATRHNPRAGAASRKEGGDPPDLQGLLSLNDVARRARMSTRMIRKHLSEIPHYRASKRGKIWIDWADFRSWVRRLRVEAVQDDLVVDILSDLAQFGAARSYERQGR